jgi:phosphohistidine phosphatase
MKELILLRHAKSSWQLNVADRHRPLTEKGMLRIQNMTLASSEVFSNAEIIFTSPANRACHTASIMAHSLNIPFEKVVLVEDLYTFEASKLIHYIRNISDIYHCVVCVGHNPAFTNAIEYFSGSDFNHLPTAAWAHLKFTQNKWATVGRGALSIGMPKERLK